MYSNVTICNYPKCNSFWKNVRLQFIVERVKIPESLDLTGFAGTKKHPKGKLSGKRIQHRNGVPDRFFHPDCHCRYRSCTDSARKNYAARGLYRRSGIAPCPETLLSLWTQYSAHRRKMQEAMGGNCKEIQKNGWEKREQARD